MGLKVIGTEMRSGKARRMGEGFQHRRRLRHSQYSCCSKVRPPVGLHPSRNMNDLLDCSRGVSLPFLSALCFQCPEDPRPRSHKQLTPHWGRNVLPPEAAFLDYCPCQSWHFDTWICRSDFSMKLPAASVKIISASGNDFSRAAPAVLLEASAQFIQPSKILTSILLTVGGKEAPIAAFFIILHHSLSPVRFLQVLPLSLRFKISSSCFSQSHKTLLHIVFYLAGRSFFFNFFWPPLNPVGISHGFWHLNSSISSCQCWGTFFHDFLNLKY